MKTKDKLYQLYPSLNSWAVHGLTKANPIAARAAEATNMKMYWTMRNMERVSADPSGE
jgi:hypothetical protein